jgi:hypothetical protein
MKMLDSLLRRLLSGFLVLIYSTALSASPVPLTNNGKEGVWFERAEAARMLDELTRSLQYKDIVITQDELIETLKDQVKTSSAIQTRTNNLLLRSEELSDHWHASYIKELERQQSFWNDPILWTAIGIAIGGIIAGGTAYAVTR